MLSPASQADRVARYAPLVLALLAAQLRAAEIPQLDCVVEPHMVVDLSTQIDSIVDTMYVERGDVVEKDQLLITLDSGVEQAAVESARARAAADAGVRAGQVSVAFAERREERIQALYDENAVSSDQFDEAETETRLARLQLNQAEEAARLAALELHRVEETLRRHTIRSPIDGVVVQRYLSPGESVRFQPMLRLAQIDPLRVEVIVPVSAFGKIQVGQKAIVQPEEPMTGNYEAEVVIVDRVADASSGTFRVALDLPNPDYSLPSGLKCMVQFMGDNGMPAETDARDPDAIQALTDSDSTRL
jgi:RND family efflux transporter MFP subunit